MQFPQDGCGVLSFPRVCHNPCSMQRSVLPEVVLAVFEADTQEGCSSTLVDKTWETAKHLHLFDACNNNNYCRRRRHHYHIGNLYSAVSHRT